MMEEGDKIKIIERIFHDKKEITETTIGLVKKINKKTITIQKINNGELTYNIGFNIADCMDKNKKFYIWENEDWQRIKFKISELNDIDDIGRGKGSKYA
ncbi:MAG: hypothetical protein ABF685_25045 [Clostridium saccharoperbutylacetonicum]